MPFQDYLKPEGDRSPVIDHAARKFLAGQKERIGQCIEKIHPHRVVFLGAGFLNDIPIETPVLEGADVYCFDWMHGVMEDAFKMRIIQNLQERAACIFCMSSGDPLKYCRNYAAEGLSNSRWPVDGGITVCGKFAASKSTGLSCVNYLPGEYPVFEETDITQGYANWFANSVDAIVERMKTPRQAIKRVVRQSRQAHEAKLLPVEDHSVDFVTSSMVVSQFDFEPFTYFIRTLLDKMDAKETQKALARFADHEEELRDSLLDYQLRGHFEEIIRILRPGGKVYLSMEFMHQEEGEKGWFQPKIVPKIQQRINEFFFYDVDFMPELMNLDIRETSTGGRSAIQAAILYPIGANSG